MARHPASLPPGTRLSDLVAVGVLAKAVPLASVMEVLTNCNKTSRRERDLPAHLVVYYVMALGLYMHCACREVLRCLLEGIRWLHGPETDCAVAGDSGISQARTRLGWEPLRRLHDELVRPIATPETRGAWYRKWRLVSLDGSTLEVPDTHPNAEAFGRPHNHKGKGGFPQIRFVSLAENGTHVLFGSRMGECRSSEFALAEEALPALGEGMLCMADRLFLCHRLWTKARANGADLLWRASKSFPLPCHERLPDGSYLSALYPKTSDRRRGCNGIRVRVIEYQLPKLAGAESLYRLVTSILDPERAPAEELAPLYHDRWEMETALDELKSHLRGPRIVLRSKTPDLVRQEFYGLMLTHFAIRGLMHEAALRADEDPHRLTYTHTVRVLRRRLPQLGAIPPSPQENPAR
jgi:Insertion element 4 transposase N-terminal/Transposase DDE domain